MLLEEEIDDRDSCKRTRSENVAVAKVDSFGDEGREEADEEVPGPVRGAGDTHAGRPVARGEQLSDHYPNDGAPGH